jgi:hypothetical protein
VATPFQVAYDILEGEGRLRCPIVERRQVVGIFRQGEAYRVVDQIGDTLVRFRGLQPQRAMQILIEVYSRSL